MRTPLIAVALLLAALPAAAQQGGAITVAGRVTDAVSGAALAGASIRGPESSLAVSTGLDGRFRLTLGRPGPVVIRRSGYATVEREVTSTDTTLVVALRPLGSQDTRAATAQSLERLTVTAVSAGDAAPVARTTLERAQIERDYSGQDLPLTLRLAPSVTAYTESGSLLNYSYFRVRGIDQSRINITLDGIPLNEPEDQQIYFSDFPDLTSSFQSIQVQRGVGTSAFCQAAYWG